MPEMTDNYSVEGVGTGVGTVEGVGTGALPLQNHRFFENEIALGFQKPGF